MMDLFERDHVYEKNIAAPVEWKKYVLVVVKFLVIFYISTFCMGVLFILRAEQWVVPNIVPFALYIFILVISAVQMIKKLPFAAIMLASPTVPLCMLIIVVSLIPVLQALDKRMPSIPTSLKPSPHSL